MKTLHIVTSLILSMVTIGLTIAQTPDQIVSKKKTVNGYQVTNTAGYNYTWTVSGTGAPTIASTTNQTGSVSWNTAGDFTVQIVPKKGSCLGETQSFMVRVLNSNIVWDAITQTECPSSANYTITRQVLTATYANASSIAGTWSFKYTIDGGAAQTVNVASGTTTATYTVAASLYDNSSSTLDAVHKIKITELTTSDGVTEDYSAESEADATTANRLFTLTVSPKPAASAITPVP